MSNSPGSSLRRRAPLFALLFLALMAVVATLTLRRATPAWEDILWLVRKRYPEVRQITVQELAVWLKDSGRTQPVFLDVRNEDEFEISHLPGAVRVEPQSTDPVLPPKIKLDTPIVTYCSVGQRSSALAQRLQEKGYTHVVNLEGSIFAWANAGYPVVRDGKEVREVHPFNSRWGLLLHKDLRAEIP